MNVCCGRRFESFQDLLKRKHTTPRNAAAGYPKGSRIGPVAEMSRTAQVDAGNVQPSGVIDPDSGLGRLPRLTARRSFEVAGAGSSPAGTTERKYRND